MKIPRILCTALLLALFIQVHVQTVHAQTEQPSESAIAFLGSPDEQITLYQGEFPHTLHVVNQSAEEIDLQVTILGLDDILQADVQAAILESGDVISVSFSLLEENLGEKRHGLVVFSSQFGDVLFKEITIDPSPRTTTPESATEDQILLANDIENVNWNDLEEKQLELSFFNDSEKSAGFIAKLYLFVNASQIETVDCGEKKTEPFSIVTMQCDLNELSQLLERGKYDGFLVVRDSQNQWGSNHKMTLHVPSSEAQPVDGPSLEFLSGEEPIVIDYNRLLSSSTVQVGLINKGKQDVMIEEAEIIILDIPDGTGNIVQDPLLLNVNAEEPRFSVPSLDTKFIGISLAPAIENPPRDGSYSGFLILRTENDQAMIIKNITLQVAAVDASLPTVTTRIANRIEAGLQPLFQRFLGVNVRFSSVEWTILAVILALGVWLLLPRLSALSLWWWNWRGKLGPIMIEDTSGKPMVAPAMRYQLARCGILPDTSAPNASTGFSGFTTVISESKIPQAQFLVTILNFIERQLRIKQGYTITSTLIGDEAKPPVSIAVEIKMSQTGQTRRIYTITGNTLDEVSKSAAFYIFHYASGRKEALRRLPKWSRFPTYTSYQIYKEADALKNAGKYDLAIKHYEEAAQESPFNALLRLGWGDTYELSNRYLEALNVYLEAALIWPHLYGFWYRIAVIFSYANEWFTDEWLKLPDDKRKSLLILINRLLMQAKIRPIDLTGQTPEENIKTFIDTSCDIWNYLDRQVNFMDAAWLVQIWRNIRSLLQPSEFQPGLMKYYWDYIILFSWGSGEQFRRMVKLAHFGTQIQRGNGDSSALQNEVQNIVDQPWNRWEVYYNAACFYGLLCKKDPRNKEAEAKAIDYLKIAIKDPRTVLDVKWVQRDPDLQALRGNLEFKALFDILDDEELKEKEAPEKKSKYHALWRLQKVADQQKDDWATPPGRQVSPEELITEADYQVRLWESLIKLCENPADQKSQELFWSLGMQNDPDAEPKPRLPDPPDDLRLDTLDACWKDIKNNAQPHLDLWNSRKQDAKVYLEHGKAQMKDVWSLWSGAEIRQWSYVHRLIRHHLRADKKK